VTTEANLEGLLRELAPRALAVVVNRSGDFSATEDATQEALLKAAQRWPVEGIPTDPLAWLVTTAVNALTDTARSATRRRLRESRYFQESCLTDGAVEHHDDTLALLFMCCHEALTPASAIALTLRAVGGLTTGEIAQAFLVPEPTMAQRISRAKRRIKEAGATFVAPVDLRHDPRTKTVLHVLYLMFSEGYVTSHGNNLGRPSLTAEAVRLTRLVHLTHPEAADPRGLLSLMLLTEARRPARTRADGSLVPLHEQDRSLWDKSLIVEGMGLLLSTRGDVIVASPYLLQAAIAATHDCSTSVAATDWPQILALYEALERHTPTAVVRLNKAVATAMVHGPRAGLDLVDDLETDLAGYHRLPAVRGHLLEMDGDVPGAATEYATAARVARTVAERDYLTAKASSLRPTIPRAAAR
jgi:RNA polymerase sigma factor (sigma-70 family)